MTALDRASGHATVRTRQNAPAVPDRPGPAAVTTLTDEMRRSLRGLGAPPDFIDIAEDADWIVTLGKYTFTAIPDIEPVTGAQILHMPFGAPHLVSAAPAMEMRTVAAALHDRYPHAEHLVIRVPAGLNLPSSQAQPVLRYLQAGTRFHPSPHGFDGEVDRVGTGEERRLVPLLVAALEAGYGTDTSTLPTITARAEQIAADAVATGCGLVARKGTTVFGQAVVLPDEDEFNPGLRWELFDLFVLPPWRGGLVARALLAAVGEFVAANGDLPLRGQVSGHGSDADRVHARLVSRGWEPAESYWSVPLASSNPRGGNGDPSRVRQANAPVDRPSAAGAPGSERDEASDGR